MATTGARDSVAEQAPRVRPFLVEVPQADLDDLRARIAATRWPGIQLIMGDAIKDSRDAPIGTFAGTTTADALTVGSYADVAHSGREAMGTFAGDPDKQRRGAFSDTDRDTVTTYRSGMQRTRTASHRRLKKILLDAGLDEAVATAAVGALHAGRVLVLVQNESALDDIAPVIDEQTLRAAA